MIVAYHVIIGAYGFWLPNDPRGSWSDFVGSWELLRYGPATGIGTTRSVAHDEHDIPLRLAAKKALKNPAVEFSGIQARAIGRGFANYVRDTGLVVRACAILPEHVHLVVDRYDFKIEYVANQLKGAATKQLVEEELHPFLHLRARKGRRPKCWARGEWSVFLETEEDVFRAIAYVEENPVKEGKPRQRWPFIMTV
jgi:REP element-mobilizing transposase RayT